MKRIYIAFILLVTVVLLCVLTHCYLHHEIDRMLTTLDNIEHTARRGDTADAVSQAEVFAADYQRVSDWISCYVSHSELRESRETAALLPALLEKGDSEELYMEIFRLRSQLRYIQDVDDPILHNIL